MKKKEEEIMSKERPDTVDPIDSTQVKFLNTTFDYNSKLF